LSGLAQGLASAGEEVIDRAEFPLGVFVVTAAMSSLSGQQCLERFPIRTLARDECNAWPQALTATREESRLTTFRRKMPGTAPSGHGSESPLCVYSQLQSRDQRERLRRFDFAVQRN